jgi:hypothetical protein
LKHKLEHKKQVISKQRRKYPTGQHMIQKSWVYKRNP